VMYVKLKDLVKHQEYILIIDIVNKL